MRDDLADTIAGRPMPALPVWQQRRSPRQLLARCCEAARPIAPVVSILLCASPAHAQEAPPSLADASGVLQEVTVTAQFVRQNLQDTPVAITAISSAKLEERGNQTIEDIARQAPNVTLTTGGAYGGPSLVAFIRGVGQTDFDPALSSRRRSLCRRRLLFNTHRLSTRFARPGPSRSLARSAGHPGRQELDRRLDQTVHQETNRRK